MSFVGGLPHVRFSAFPFPCLCNEVHCSSIACVVEDGLAPCAVWVQHVAPHLRVRGYPPLHTPPPPLPSPSLPKPFKQTRVFTRPSPALACLSRGHGHVSLPAGPLTYVYSLSRIDPATFAVPSYLPASPVLLLLAYSNVQTGVQARAKCCLSLIRRFPTLLSPPPPPLPPPFPLRFFQTHVHTFVQDACSHVLLPSHLPVCRPHLPAAPLSS